MSLVPGGDALVPQAEWQGGEKVWASVGANDPDGHDHCPGFYPHLPAPCPLSDANSYSNHCWLHPIFLKCLM